MFPQKPPKWAIGIGVALLLVGLGTLVYNNGWSQGFISGLLINGTDGANLSSYMAYRGGPGWGHGGFGFFGFFFRGLFFLLLLGLIFRAVGCRRWHNGHGPWRGPWSQEQGPERGEWRWHPYGPDAGQGEAQPGSQPTQPGQPQQATGNPAGNPGVNPTGDESQGGTGTHPVSWQSPVIDV